MTPRARLWLSAAMSVLWLGQNGASQARADGLRFDINGARAIGRAGAVAVSEDGAAALLVNPAGMARREQWRAQAGMVMIGRGLDYLASEGAGQNSGEPAPLVENRAPAARAPLLSGQGPLGPLVVGFSYIETGVQSLALPTPQFNQPVGDVGRLYPHRYSGTRFDYRSRSLQVGVAIRATSWLGLGISVGAARVSLREDRHIWAGFAGRDEALAPERDLALTLTGTDAFVPALVAGTLVAPPDIPLEMAVSVRYSAGARVRGVPSVSETRQAVFPAFELNDPTNQLELGSRVLVRSGVRYLGERFSLEFAGELEVVADEARAWSLTGVAAVDESTARGALEQVPALAVERSQGGLRWAADTELVPGFLWLSGGYALTLGGSPRGRVSPTFADLGGHTLALGVEGQWNGITARIGYARTLTHEMTQARSDTGVVNPFDAGGGRAGEGRYRTSRDVVGAGLEAAW